MLLIGQAVLCLKTKTGFSNDLLIISSRLEEAVIGVK
jgi:hypothetical protein